MLHIHSVLRRRVYGATVRAYSTAAAYSNSDSSPLGTPAPSVKVAAASGVGNGEVRTTFWYLQPLELYKTVKPYHINVPPNALPPGTQSNEQMQPYSDIPVTDLRGREHEFTLDRHGFQVFKDLEEEESKATTDDAEAKTQGSTRLSNCLGFEEYADSKAIRKTYRLMVEKFLSTVLGAELVRAFTHDVRRRDPFFSALPRGSTVVSQPIQGVHVGKALFSEVVLGSLRRLINKCS